MIDIRTTKTWRWLFQSKPGRLLIHIPHGICIGYGLLWRPWVGMGWLALCVSYQVLEDWRLEDRSYIDLWGYMVGFWVGVAIYSWG